MKAVTRTAAQTAVLMAILTLVSKCLGFVREMILAMFFGAGATVDAYVMATAIPNILLAGILSAVGTSYMPLYSKIHEQEGETASLKFTSEVINLLWIVTLLATVIGAIFARQLVAIFASGFSGETAELTAFYLRIAFCTLMFTSATNILDYYLKYKNIFLYQITAGYIQNIVIIVVIIISAYTNQYYLIIGFMLGNIVRCSVIWWISRKKQFKYIPSLNIKGTGMRILALSLPVFIGSSVSQLNTFVDKTLASNLIEGSVSALNYAVLLNNMVSSLTTAIIVSIIYPKITQACSQNNSAEYARMMKQGLSLIIMIALPFSMGAMLFSHEIVQIVYERGAFDVAATSMTGSAYFYYSAGMLFSAINGILAQSFYAKHDMKTPMLSGCVSLCVNIVLSIILVRFMQHSGLALATSIAAFTNTLQLSWRCRSKFTGVSILPSIRKIVKIGIAAVCSIATAYFINMLIVTFASEVIYMRMVQVGLAVVVAMALYLLLLRIMKVEDLDILKTIIGRRGTM